MKIMSDLMRVSSKLPGTFPFGLSADDLSAVVLTEEEASEEVYRRLIPRFCAPILNLV
jgi:hypothetical protein